VDNNSCGTTCVEPFLSVRSAEAAASCANCLQQNKPSTLAHVRKRNHGRRGSSNCCCCSCGYCFRASPTPPGKTSASDKDVSGETEEVEEIHDSRDDFVNNGAACRQSTIFHFLLHIAMVLHLPFSAARTGYCNMRFSLHWRQSYVRTHTAVNSSRFLYVYTQGL
jgi:hypothetical protein